jgi:CRP/FNR family transcriptional regulator, cyclic AMP receptor protein
MARGKDSKLESLAKIRLFAALNKKDLQLVGRAAEEVQVPAGRCLVEQGKPGHEMYVILEGEAAVKKNGRKIATLGPGKYFGELAVLTRAPRNATIESATDMTLLVMGQREFAGVLDEVPGLAHKLLSSMAERLAEADRKSVEQ